MGQCRELKNIGDRVCKTFILSLLLGLFLCGYVYAAQVEPKITIMDVYSESRIGSVWTVKFKTTGTADLTITSNFIPNESSLIQTKSNNAEHQNPYDLKFMELKSGSRPQRYRWITGSRSKNERSVYIKDFSSNETNSVVCKILSPGRQTLLFKFGEDIVRAFGYVVGDEIFLQGNYVEVGIHAACSFGTSASAPGGFHPMGGRTQLGFVADMDKDGWDVGSPSQSGDYFLPGSPEEGWAVEWTYGGTERTKGNFGRQGLFTIPVASLTDNSSGSTQSAVWEGTASNGTDEKLEIVKTVHFDEDDLFFIINTVITNTGTVSLDSVEFLRNVDPDNDRDLPGGSYTTRNYIAYQPGVGGNTDKALVVAKGYAYPVVTLGLGTIDSRAVVSSEGFSNRDPDAILDSPTAYTEASPHIADEAIALAYRFGTLAPGQSVTFDYAYILSESDLEEALGSLAAVTIIQPTGTVSGSSVLFQATTDDVPNTSQIEFFVDGSSIGTDTTPDGSGVFERTFDSTSYSNGSLSLKAVATISGSTYEKSSTVTVDNSGPPIEFSTPTSGQSFSGSSIPIAITVLDAGHPPVRVSFFRETPSTGSLFLEQDTSAPFESSFGVTDLPDGETVVIKAVAYDDLDRVTTIQVSGTKVSVTTPTITTTAASSITAVSADSGGNVTDSGGASVTGRGVCWSTSANPTTADSYTEDGTGTGSFTSSLSGLIPNTTYHVRAYATNSQGTDYGNDISFTTLIAAPSVTTTAVSSITTTSAESGGEVTDSGGGSVTGRGVCWSTSANPTTADSYTEDGTGTGSFASSLGGLIPNTAYHVRAYATNEAGTAYGNELTFTTLDDPPLIEIISPDDGSNVYGIIDVQAQASDDVQISEVNFFINGQKVDMGLTGFSSKASLRVDSGDSQYKEPDTDYTDSSAGCMDVDTDRALALFLNSAGKLRQIDAQYNIGQVLWPDAEVQYIQLCRKGEYEGILFVVFKEPQILNGGFPFAIMGIDLQHDLYGGIDRSTTAVKSDFSHSKAFQFDDSGNIYYITSQDNGTDILRKCGVQNQSEVLISDSIRINEWMVEGNGTVLIAGEAPAVGEPWFMKFMPDKGLSQLAFPPAEVEWILDFPDGRTYACLTDNRAVTYTGIYRLSSDLSFISEYKAQFPYIGKRDYRFSPEYNISSLAASGFVDWERDKLICYDSSDELGLFALVGNESGDNKILQYFPRLGIIELTLCDTPEWIKLFDNQLIVFGTTGGMSRLVVYDLLSGDEVDITPADLTIGHLDVLGDGSIVFEGRSPLNGGNIIGVVKNGMTGGSGFMEIAAPDETLLDLLALRTEKEPGNELLNESEALAADPSSLSAGSDRPERHSTDDSLFSFTWNTLGYENGSYEIKAVAADTAGQKVQDIITLNVLNLQLTLEAKRAVASAWIVERHYGDITFTVNNPGSVPVSKYIIYRKTQGEGYQQIKNVPASSVTGGSYTFFDKYLDKNKTYTYVVIAYDEDGFVLGESNEKSI